MLDLTADHAANISNHLQCEGILLAMRFIFSLLAMQQLAFAYGVHLFHGLAARTYSHHQ